MAKRPEPVPGRGHRGQWGLTGGKGAQGCLRGPGTVRTKGLRVSGLRPAGHRLGEPRQAPRVRPRSPAWLDPSCRPVPPAVVGLADLPVPMWPTRSSSQLNQVLPSPARTSEEGSPTDPVPAVAEVELAAPAPWGAPGCALRLPSSLSAQRAGTREPLLHPQPLPDGRQCLGGSFRKTPGACSVAEAGAY